MPSISTPSCALLLGLAKSAGLATACCCCGGIAAAGVELQRALLSAPPAAVNRIMAQRVATTIMPSSCTSPLRGTRRWRGAASAHQGPRRVPCMAVLAVHSCSSSTARSTGVWIAAAIGHAYWALAGVSIPPRGPRVAAGCFHPIFELHPKSVALPAAGVGGVVTMPIFPGRAAPSSAHSRPLVGVGACEAAAVRFATW
jgi:hypothetical protein